jgi:RNA polymerase sigma-70 factor (ECF subfamily)
MERDLLSSLTVGFAEANGNHHTTRIARSANSPSDQDLIDAVLVGDTTQFDGLVSRYSDRIYHFILKNIRQTAIAEELTQETFVEAYRKLPAFKGEAKFSSWLFGIALNRARNYFNRSPDRHRCYLPVEVVSHSIPADGNPVQYLERKQALLALQQAIDALPPELQEGLILVVLEELSYEEAAQVMGIPIGTVKSRVHRARDLLRGSMKPNLDG